MKKYLVFLCVVSLFFSFVGVVGAVPTQRSENGHYYEAISSPYIMWDDAKIAAEGSSYFGVSGHLATITSQKENDFIFYGLSIGANPYWLGGFQPTGSAEPGGNWQWVNGEGLFWDNGSTPLYENWAAGEPNNLTWGDEGALSFLQSMNNGTWNDAPKSYQYYNGGYVVEYDVPEPVTILLLGFGLIGLAGLKRKA